MTNRPEANEYHPYYDGYINQIPEGDIRLYLGKQIHDISQALKELSEKQASFRYGPEKWTIKEVIGHITDTEQIMSYRLLAIVRGETSELPGFDEKIYVQNAHFNHLSIHELIEGFCTVRETTLHLLKGLVKDDWIKQGNANGANVTVRAIAYIIAGHALHHLQIIKDRYINSPDFPSN